MLAFERLYGDRIPGVPGLFVEGIVTAGLGSGLALWMFAEQAGMVAIFLCAIGSLGSIERQLAWNRSRIFEHQERPLSVNVRFTARVLALFAGQLLAFSVVAATADTGLLGEAFVTQLGGFADHRFPTIDFPPLREVLLHNLGVLCVFFVLALLFRHAGTLLAVAWNASVWGVVFGWLARTWTEGGGPPLAEAYARVMAGVTPHLLLEATGYVLVGFAGVFLRQGLAKHSAESPVWDSLSRSLATMVGSAALLVSAGAAWEAFVAGWICRWLAS